MATDPVRVVVYFWKERFDGREVWRAECTTLNLVTERPTYAQAVLAMQDQLVGYAETVLHGNPAGLIPRKSPLSRRIRYWTRHRFSRWTSRPDTFVHEQPLDHCC